MRLLAAAALLAASVGTTAAERKIHMVYMGGNDCPPCRAWRAKELPKLQTMLTFQRVQFTYVDKLIRSAVPPSMLLPAEVRPYKDKLDAAGNRLVGSPQTAILVDGEVYDYYFGTRNAEEIETMLRAILQGQKYPFERCVRRESQKKCAVKG